MADDGPRLVVQNTVLKGRVYPLKPEGVTIGRGAENDIFVDLPSVSRQHARVEKAEGSWHVRDLGSRNGIRIDDQPMREADLKPGQIFAVGDVLFQFQTAASAIPVAEGAENPAPAEEARPAMARPGIPMAPQERGGEGEEVRRGVLLMSVTMACLALVVAAGGYWYLNLRDPEPRRRALSPVKVAVGESRLVWLQGAEIVAATIQSDAPSIASAERYEEKYLLVTGRSAGSTTLRMETLRGNEILLRVLVRGRREDPMETYQRMQLNERERRRRAARYVEAGDRLAQADPARALEQYRIALTLMQPVPDKGQMVIHANRQVQTLEKRIQEKYRELISSAQLALADKNVERGLFYLQEVLDLIPDEQDPRHQRAYLRIKEVLLRTQGED